MGGDDPAMLGCETWEITCTKCTVAGHRPPRCRETVITMTQRTGNIIFSVLLIVVSGYLIHMALGFKGAGHVASSELSSGFFPIAILSFIIACCLINIVQNLKAKSAVPKAAKIELDRTQFIRVTSAFATCVVSYFIWERFGFIAMSTVFMVATSLVLGVRSVKIYVFLLLFGPVIYFIFDRALQITLQ
jgi:hypothetical protein